MPNYANLSYDNLGGTGKLYPNPDPEHSDGTAVLFDERFNTDDGLAHLVPAQWLPARELPNADYPLVLNTGRLLEHWHTGSMTRRSYALGSCFIPFHFREAAANVLTIDEIDLGWSRVRAAPGSLCVGAVEPRSCPCAPPHRPPAHTHPLIHIHGSRTQ